MQDVQVICQAIARRRLLAFDYDGHHRTVEPHCHGTGATGVQLLRAYQIGGTSTTGHLGWKLFDITRVSSPGLLADTFVPRPDYRPDDVAMHPVHCSV